MRLTPARLLFGNALAVLCTILGLLGAQPVAVGRSPCAVVVAAVPRHKPSTRGIRIRNGRVGWFKGPLAANRAPPTRNPNIYTETLNTIILSITQRDTNTTAADGTANVESTIWDIKNPETVVRLLQGNHKIRLHLNKAGPTAITVGEVKLIITDPEGNHRKVIYTGDLDLFTGAQINVLETQTIDNTWGTFPFYHILVVVNSPDVVSAAVSKFGLQVEAISNISFEEAKATFAEFLLG